MLRAHSVDERPICTQIWLAVHAQGCKALVQSSESAIVGMGVRVRVAAGEDANSRGRGRYWTNGRVDA